MELNITLVSHRDFGNGTWRLEFQYLCIHNDVLHLLPWARKLKRHNVNVTFFPFNSNEREI